MSARVLVIDDNRSNLELIAYLLRAFGHEATVAASAGEALALTQRAQFDLILCDMLMPAMDGHEFARRFQESATRKIPIIAVTALAMVGDRERILASGFDGYLPKPIEPETFVWQVEAFLPETLRSSAAPRSKNVVPTVLIVDDDPNNRHLLSVILAHGGYRTIEASDGMEGVRLARETQPALAIIDLHMPRMSGTAFVAELRQIAELDHTKLVLSTATPQNAAMTQFMEVHGIEHVIPKPCEPEEVLTIVAAILGPGSAN